MMGAQFRDERCACDHPQSWHATAKFGNNDPELAFCCVNGCDCQRFVERAERKEEEAEG